MTIEACVGSVITSTFTVVNNKTQDSARTFTARAIVIDLCLHSFIVLTTCMWQPHAILENVVLQYVGNVLCIAHLFCDCKRLRLFSRTGYLFSCTHDFDTKTENHALSSLDVPHGWHEKKVTNQSRKLDTCSIGDAKTKDQSMS